MSQKPRKPHPINSLNAVRVRSLSKPGRYSDGNGLFLLIDRAGSKRWVLRTVIQGRRTDLGLGSARLVPLAEAREQAIRLRKVARAGGDPLADRKRERRPVPTFSSAAIEVHAARAASFRNPKHAAQWIQTLRTFVFPIIGGRRIDQVQSGDVLRVLSPIWLTTPETARRIRQRIQTVLAWGKAQGYVFGDNAAADVSAVLPRHVDSRRHFEAMPYLNVPSFVASLTAGRLSEQVRLGIELMVLTALRTKELRLGEWREISWGDATWTIPPERQLKKKKPTSHIVPLSRRSLEVLQRLKSLAGSSAFIFPGRKEDKPVSDMTFLMALRRLGLKVTGHGFRSSFRDWASEETDHKSEVIEKSLAHEIHNKVEAAYRRGDLLSKRRALMNDWAEYVTGGGSNDGRQVESTDSD